MSHFSLLTDFDIHLFRAGKHFKIYEKLGSHITKNDENTEGVFFAVWAPNARKVSVMGNFNFWSKTAHEMTPRWDGSGIWEVFIPEAKKGDTYKYVIRSPDGRLLEKTDPFAFMWETPPNTASIIWDLEGYEWKDQNWLKQRAEKADKPQPYTVYELHAGSWKRNSFEGNRSLTYREMAEDLVPYVAEMGFTHVEFMPIMEHPYEPSWGYQTLGYFAPTSRFGTPQDFMFLVDAFHQAGVGVILDWVPSHYPMDAHGLYDFDGTHLYEHADPRKGYHPDWKSAIYNYGRNEVRGFLIASACFWLEKYHADGLRVDAVASMLYLDYSRKEGEWIPNQFGSNMNLEAIAFLRELNEAIYGSYPDVVTIAEESTAYSGVSRPTWTGGLGFGQKWMMGWMHDTLNYLKRQPIHRRYHHNEITFSLVYAFSENFMLPLSHDEVVYGKGSLLSRMPGDEWQRFANLRLLFGYMFTHPGTRLLFMGCEFGQGGEWSFEGQLDWWLLDSPFHKGVQNLVKSLNNINKTEGAIYEKAYENDGFDWLAYDDAQNCVIGYLRKGNEGTRPLVVVCNMTPQILDGYEMGVPNSGEWREILNTDAEEFNGSGVINSGVLTTLPKEKHGRDYVLKLKLAPLATMIFALEKEIKMEKPAKKAVKVKKIDGK